MKRLIAILLLCVPLVAQAPQKSRVHEIKLEPGKGTYIPLNAVPVRFSRFHFSSDYPIIVFFSNEKKAKQIHLSDGIGTLGDCSAIHVKEIDIWCDNGFNDRIYIVDSRDSRKSDGTNVIRFSVVGMGKPQSN